MKPRQESVTLHLTPEEALELFTLCLKSPEPDTSDSRSALRKLAAAVQPIAAEQLEAS
jgi:hypothetical protein